jgi:hypothetical protein
VVVIVVVVVVVVMVVGVGSGVVVVPTKHSLFDLVNSELHVAQSPFELQSVQPADFPLRLQQLRPRHSLDKHELLEEHASPSSINRTHSLFVVVYSELHTAQFPRESQSVHPADFPLALQQLRPRHTPDEHELLEEHASPSLMSGAEKQIFHPLPSPDPSVDQFNVPDVSTKPFKPEPVPL